MQDITLRALQTLRETDLIAAEDTRRSAILLLHHNIKKPMISLHEHNEEARTAELVEEIAGGKSVVLITDAGMPGISDPGFRLIRACRERGLGVDVLRAKCSDHGAGGLQAFPPTPFTSGIRSGEKRPPSR